MKISMDGKGRWMDNVFIERLWRSLKYECVHLQAFETGSQARTGIGRVDRLLQHQEASFGARWTHARGAGGMKFTMGSHPTNAAKLSNDWGPPLSLLCH